MINQTRNNRALFDLMSFGVSGMGFFICLPLLLALASASGQTLAPTREAPRNEPLEFYDNPPAPPRKIETSPRMISQLGPFVSFQVNVDQNGQNIIGDAANECAISVDPTDGSKMTIAWRQFNSVLSNFRQAGWGYTTDGGITWTFPGVLENNVFRSDPVTNSNEVGNFFYLSLQSDVNQSFFCDDLWRSLNGGQSWTLLSGERGGGGGDKEWFTIDKTNGPGHGFQYQSWDTTTCSGSGQFSRSTDGGVTWMTSIAVPNSADLGTLDVATNGNLFVGGEGEFNNVFYCIRSSNAQIGNQTPVFDQVTAVNMGGTLGGGGINPAGLDGQLFLAVDRSGGPTNNKIYMLASVVPPGRNTTDVMFARSTDGGLTFSAPHKINDDPVNPSKWHWFGTFSVAPNGRLDAVWYDTRNAANNTDSQLFYSWSTDAGVTWAANVEVSVAFNPFEGYPNQSKIGDYITIVSDATGGNVAYSATFNFNPNRGQHEEDVYYVRVFPGGQGGTPTPTPTASPTPTSTPTASPTPTPCVGQYVITQIGGSIVPGTTDIGNHGDDTVTTIALPFSYTLYDQTFTSINLSSNGNAQFTTTDTTFTNQCLPWTTHNYTIYPYWDDLYLVNSGFGIFTSVSGTAPNRIFNIEWRAQYFPGSGTANLELRLYEGQTRFDVIYGTVSNGNSSATAGVQKNDTAFDQYFCNGAGMPATGAQSYILTPCGTPTPTPTGTQSPTPTATATA